MTKASLLVELCVEELPPKALRKLGAAFGEGLFAQLKGQGLVDDASALTTFASPRRLGVHVTAVRDRADDRKISQKLMPASVGLDASGNATPALLKKLHALGADASVVPGLRRAMDGKAEALFYDSTAQGATVADGLQKGLDEAIAKLPIPKVMTYQLSDGWTDVKFVRPVHALVALHGDEVVRVRALGLEAGRSTHGHRFEAVADPVVLKDADSYALAMERDGSVIPSFEARRAEIVRQLGVAAARASAAAHATQTLRPIEDEALLDEVTALVERPNVLVCEFEREFLEVPQECLILTMKANQKYFPLLAGDGKLSNKFLVVSNIRPDDPSAVIQGNERVVRPRLADAKFFYDQDRKKPLESRVAGLDKVVYHNKLGSQGERVQRVRAIARAIGQQLGGESLAAKADRAAMLAKADLLTDMVGEFPELQGTMGRYYAHYDGLGSEIADAIEDHYKPRFAGDALPRGDVGVVVALADKLETLVGMFAIGNMPSGEKDPYALRRHALGVIRIILEREVDLTIGQAVDHALAAFEKLVAIDDSAQVYTSLVTFVQSRFDSYLEDKGFARELVLSISPIFASAPLADMPKRLAAVRAFAALPEAPALAAANKRIANILKKAESAEAHVSELLLQEDAERTLYASTTAVASVANAQFDAGDYTASLKTLAALREPVDAFFDQVMVNAEQDDLRRNRLGLLATLHQAMNRVADLSKLAA